MEDGAKEEGRENWVSVEREERDRAVTNTESEMGKAEGASEKRATGGGGGGKKERGNNRSMGIDHGSSNRRG